MANGDRLIGIVESLLLLILAGAEERESVERVRFAGGEILGGGDLDGALVILGGVLWMVLDTGGVAESVEGGDALCRVLGEAGRVDGAGVSVGGVLRIGAGQPEVAQLIQDFCGSVRVAGGHCRLQGRLELGDAGLIIR